MTGKGLRHARRIDSMATLAVALHSELKALSACTHPSRTIRFSLQVSGVGTRKYRATVFSDTTAKTARWSLSAAQKSDREAAVHHRLLSNSLVHLVPALAHNLATMKVVDPRVANPFFTAKPVGKSKAKRVQFELDDAIALLVEAIHQLVTVQAVGAKIYPPNDDLLAAYIGVLSHAADGKPGSVKIPAWKSLVDKFRKACPDDAKHFTKLDDLHERDDSRKAEATRAQDLGLTKAAGTRSATITQRGIDFAEQCRKAASEGKAMPQPSGE
jgi:hypothetical protein